MRIFVTGATGTVGRHVVEQLLTAGAAVRALTRRPESAGLPAAVEVVGGDLEKPESLASAFDGVNRMYLLATGDTQQVVDLAKQAGVRRVVVLSSANAGFENDPGGEFHRATERVVEGSGLEWTHVRPGMFAGNLLDWADAIRAEGVVKAPYGAARQSPVHEFDIAAVAATALVSDGHHGKIYTLSGPEALTKPEQVAAISKAIGRDIRFEELTPEQWREHVKEEIPPFAIDWLLGLWAETVDNPEPVLPTVQQVLDRPARTVAEWAADHAEDFRSSRRSEGTRAYGEGGMTIPVIGFLAEACGLHCPYRSRPVELSPRTRPLPARRTPPDQRGAGGCRGPARRRRRCIRGPVCCGSRPLWPRSQPSGRPPLAAHRACALHRRWTPQRASPPRR